MATELLDLLNTFPFDGHIDDLESSNSYQPYGVIAPHMVAWYNLMAQTVHSAGKKAAFYEGLENPWTLHKTVFPGIVGLDFIIARFNPNAATNPEYMQDYNDILTYLPSNIEWLPQIRVTGAQPNPTDNLQHSIDFYNIAFAEGKPSNFGGFTVWVDYFFAEPEKTLWKNWNNPQQTQPQTFNLNIEPSINGVTNPTGLITQEIGATLQVTAFANEGFTLEKWMLDTLDLGSENPITVTFDADHVLTAVFKYTSTYIAYASGVSQTDIAVLRVFGHRYLSNKLIGFYDWCGPHLARLVKYQILKKVLRKVIEWLTCQLKRNLTL